MDTKLTLAHLIASAMKEAYPQAENLPGENEIAGFMEIPPETAMGDYAFPCFKLWPSMVVDRCPMWKRLAMLMEE